jgi:hypothetical protein
VADDALHGHIGIRDVVGPELMPGVDCGLTQNGPGCGGRMDRAYPGGAKP